MGRLPRAAAYTPYSPTMAEVMQAISPNSSCRARTPSSELIGQRSVSARASP